ncbi:hypothetical protein DFH06DRAFT_1333038 [Mycena polygramma]|nr:hypothetical protein DFH06DRAFT_1333038 [Mycena polygramma]
MVERIQPTEDYDTLLAGRKMEGAAAGGGLPDGKHEKSAWIAKDHPFAETGGRRRVIQIFKKREWVLAHPARWSLASRRGRWRGGNAWDEENEDEDSRSGVDDPFPADAGGTKTAMALSEHPHICITTTHPRAFAVFSDALLASFGEDDAISEAQSYDFCATGALLHHKMAVCTVVTTVLWPSSPKPGVSTVRALFSPSMCVVASPRQRARFLYKGYGYDHTCPAVAFLRPRAHSCPAWAPPSSFTHLSFSSSRSQATNQPSGPQRETDPARVLSQIFSVPAQGRVQECGGMPSSLFGGRSPNDGQDKETIRGSTTTHALTNAWGKLGRREVEGMFPTPAKLAHGAAEESEEEVLAKIRMTAGGRDCKERPRISLVGLLFYHTSAAASAS